MKYVITDQNKVAMGTGCFHSDLARSVTGKVISAGDVSMSMKGSNLEINVSGQSDYFRVPSRVADARVIASHLGIIL